MNSFENFDFYLIFFEKLTVFKRQSYPKGECKYLRRYDRKSVGQPHAQKLDFKKSENDAKTKPKSEESCADMYKN